MIQLRKSRRAGWGSLVVLVLAILLAVTAPVSAAPPDTDPGPPPEQFFVLGFHELPPGLARGQEIHGAAVRRVDPTLRFARVVTRSPQQFQDRARSDRRTRYVEPDPDMPLALNTPNDPRFSDQYGPQRVGAPQAWDMTMGDQDARLCVLDTGVRYTHEEIAGARWLGGTDYVNEDSDPMDDDGHGTHVTGIAAGAVNNGKGVAGMGNVGIYGVKVLDDKGKGAWSGVASGIAWCADRGGRAVINMSLGASSDATVLQDGVKYAAGKGALMVAAAGNSGSCSNCVDYPAKYGEVIAVTCTTSTDKQCSFSSDGPESELAAPGNSILSLGNSSDTAYTSISGTSMSTPHVAGAAALVWSQHTQLSADQLRERLRGSARDLGAVGWDEVYGYGL
ncbi:MAG TPA: S8 family serine peptidase, partial [Acidimicrobiales bacterium]|nr:S8 family serine peptidase [Acidimicrobiales bacterium]